MEVDTVGIAGPGGTAARPAHRRLRTAALILAGAAAESHSAARVIAMCGAVGAVAALAIAVTWTRGYHRRTTERLQRPKGLAPGFAAHVRAPCLVVVGGGRFCGG